MNSHSGQQTKTVSAGYCSIVRQGPGRGYATEAAKMLLTYLFTAENAHRVFARLDAENEASRRLCERLGMREEAHLIENDRDGDRWGSEYVYAILAR
ncbi:GNAT family N-acetyltransferase [Arthrobacter antibioticus]|uniref:GNAT family N-acetyltransferase n=1 Tax=Arthrobacter sp. H35-MC1 TaxID=3046203 RepID=UPI0024BAA792|nr:GNAT family protein [Arthrobacter sp. H35-MC1]MDJ0315815.1 GNAT family protein [Arthrobacter sp. H35-MC1]